MTYSIIARCPRTGRFGVGSTTFSMACGRRNESVRPNVGVSKSQAFYLRYVDPLALNMLAQGYTPQHIVRMLAADDPDFDYRQFGIIDRENNVVAHTGPGCGQWAGHTVGPYYAAYGNGLAGPQTVAGIISGFLKQPGAPLEDRLLMALEGGRDAGGQMSKGIPRPERSAWIRVVDRLDFPEIDVRVDLHDKTVAELRRVLEEFKHYRDYYAARSANPQAAMPEEEFVAGLNARAAQVGHPMNASVNVPYRGPITEPCAWKADELRRDPSWIYELSKTEIAEIEAALQAVNKAGVPLLSMRARDFPLTQTARRLRDVSAQLEHGRGIAWVRGVPVARYDDADLEKIYWGLSVHLGVVIAQNTRGDHIGHVRDEGLQWGQVSGGELVRGYRTNAYMPFHSDPTDRVGLFCVQKAKVGGLSSIASSTAVYNEILARRPPALDCLFRGFHYSLRGEASGGIAQVTEYRVPIFDYFAGKLSSRYVRKTIEQAAAIGGVPLSEEESAALDLLDSLVKSDELRFDMSFEPGDIQYLNNHVSFHSRTGFEDDPDPRKRRHLMRVWLQSADARPLSPVMSRPHGARSPFLSREQALEREAGATA